jgi:hypothetical protein
MAVLVHGLLEGWRMKLYLGEEHGQAAATYKVDTEAITAKVREEFAAKEKAKKAAQPAAKNATKAA